MPWAVLRIVLMLAVVFGAILVLVTNPIKRKRNVVAFSVRASRLRTHVETLASRYFPRDYEHVENLDKSASYIRDVFRAATTRVQDQEYAVNGKEYRNVVASFGPETSERIVVGAHYDAVSGIPGADDNASGVAGLLELAGMLKNVKLGRRVDMVAYSTEEPPFFGSGDMGSAVNAQNLRSSGVKLRAMLSLEMIGYYSDVEGSQGFPMQAMRSIYPDTGNFIAVAARISDELLTRKIKQAMSVKNGVDVYSVNAPAGLAGISLSDNSSYWREGYPAVMITDTAFFRNHNYHMSSDTPETLDYQRMAKVVAQVSAAVVFLSNE